MNATLARRSFIRQLTLAASAAALMPGGGALAAGRPMHVSCNQYVWSNFYQRAGKNYGEHIDQALAEMASAGLNGVEPFAGSPQEMEGIAALARKHGLEVRSLYVNSTLHDPARVEQSIAAIVATARTARDVGTRIIVTNPDPIKWGGPENKDDTQLECQARAMNELGRRLSALGLKLAYHNHDIELRQAAREVHHMMAGTDPRHVHLCLDAHWMFRGAGNSQVALFDIVKLYGRRIVELHLRQSKGGIWTETLGDGDIDYGRLVAELKGMKVKPLLVIEQAVESGTPNTMDVVGAIRASVPYVRRVFAPIS